MENTETLTCKKSEEYGGRCWKTENKTAGQCFINCKQTEYMEGELWLRRLRTQSGRSTRGNERGRGKRRNDELA
jgi:hypothetical protein